MWETPSSYVLGLDQYGNKTWEKTYTPGPSFGANDIIPMGDGFLVVGNCFLRIDNRGNRAWWTTIPYEIERPGDAEEAKAITEAGDGGFVFVGVDDFYVAKVKGSPSSSHNNTGWAHPNYFIPEFSISLIWSMGLITALIGCYRKIRGFEPDGYSNDHVLMNAG